MCIPTLSKGAPMLPPLKNGLVYGSDPRAREHEPFNNDLTY